MIVRKLIYKGFYYVLVSLFALSITAATVVVASNKPVVCPATNANDASSALFAYCGPAKCTPDTKNQYAMCEGCVKLKGANIGTTTCEERAPKKLSNGDMEWTSSWTMKKDIGPNFEPLTKCVPKEGEDQYYANCLNAKCKEGKEKNQLDCKCLVTESKGGAWVGQVKNCNEVNSNSYCESPGGNKILNGAPYALVAGLLKIVSKKNPELMCAPLPY
jgi:hypothetical protein